MLLADAVDRVVGHLQRSAGTNREQIRAALMTLHQAGIVHFEPDPQEHGVQLRALLSECERITAGQRPPEPRVRADRSLCFHPRTRRRTVTMPVLEMIERRQAKVDVEDAIAAFYYMGYDVVRRRPG